MKVASTCVPISRAIQYSIGELEIVVAVAAKSERRRIMGLYVEQSGARVRGGVKKKKTSQRRSEA